MRITAATVVALAAVLGAGTLDAAPPAQSQEELEQRVRILERKLEVAEEEKQAKAREATTPAAGEKGFGFRNADGSYEFKFKGLVQADGRFYSGDAQAFNDSWLLRRVEPTFELTLGKLAFLKIQPQFAGDSAGTSDVYGELRFAPIAGLRFGKFKPPVGLENLQSTGALSFIERGLPNEVASGRDLGLQLQGELPGGTTSYQVAWLNGAADGRDAASSDTDNRKEVAARVFFEPFRAEPGFFQNLGFGVAATRGIKHNELAAAAPLPGSSAFAAASANFNNTLPRYRSPGQNTVFTYRSSSTAPTSANTTVADGTHARLSPQLHFYRNSFGLLGEYITSEQEVSFNGVGDEFEHKAWQVVVNYVLTGEDASYKGTKPAAPFAADGGWGAFEVALRIGKLDIDDAAFPVYANPDTAVTGLSDLGLALNWYLTGNARLAVNYDRTQFDGGAAAGADRDDEKAFFTRLQLSF